MLTARAEEREVAGACRLRIGVYEGKIGVSRRLTKIGEIVAQGGVNGQSKNIKSIANTLILEQQ